MRAPTTCLLGLSLFALSACASSRPPSTSTATQPKTGGVAAVSSGAEPFARGTAASALVAEQGEPDFVSRRSPRTARMLDALGAEQALHYRFPDSASLSFAVGVRGGKVTGTVVFVDAGPSSMYVDPIDYYHTRARGERTHWTPAGVVPSSVAASAPRTASSRLGAAVAPGW